MIKTGEKEIQVFYAGSEKNYERMNVTLKFLSMRKNITLPDENVLGIEKNDPA